MKRILTKLVCAVGAFAALAACTAGQSAGPTINAVDPNYGRLQFAVGTANLYGTNSGLNVASTLRQPNGHSAYGVDMPTITGPFTFGVAAAPANGGLTDPYTTTFTVPPGPSLPETTAPTLSITGTPQTVHPGTPFCDTVQVISGFTTCPPGVSPNASTFGQSGGVFAMGLAPYNAVAATGQSYSYQPYPEPIYENTTHPQFVAWGGPPAFDPDGDGMGTRDGLIVNDTDSFGFPYFLGVGEGVSIFEGVNASSGSYTMSVQLAIAGPNGTQIITKSASANLVSLAQLPTISAPTVVPDGTGGATFTIAAGNFPAGVTEALVQMIDYGPGGGPANGNALNPNCQGAKGTSFAPVYYTIEVTALGAFVLGNAHGPNIGGPNLTASQSICTAAQNNATVGVNAGDNFTVQVIGFDYPDYEAAVSLLGNNVPQAPQIAGANGQADITVSVPQEEDYPGYSPVPLLHVHRSMRPMMHKTVVPSGRSLRF